MTHNERPPLPLERAVPDLARLPRHPGPGAAPVRCTGRKGTCNHVVALVDGEVLFIRHGGGEWIARLPAEARCERCGHRTPIGRKMAA